MVRSEREENIHDLRAQFEKFRSEQSQSGVVSEKRTFLEGCFGIKKHTDVESVA